MCTTLYIHVYDHLICNMLSCDVFQIKYYHELRQVISCSNHANTALVIGK